MNSKTSDYTVINRPSLDKDLQYRGFSSAVKNRTYNTKKFNLAPLDLKEIKKELEEEERSREYKYSSEGVENVLRNLSNHSTTQKRLEKPEINEEKEDSTTISSIKPHITTEKENKPNSLANSLNYDSCDSISAANVRTKVQENDSFDLDFSALSLETPVKSYKTVKFCQEDSSTNRNECIVNNENHKLQLTASKNQFVTPKNPGRNTSARTTTPFLRNGNIVCSIPKTVPEEETFKKIIVNNVEYLILNLLGRGGSSEVYQCYSLKNKLLVAIKCVSLHDKSSSVGYINEVMLLKQLQNCDKIIKMYDFEIVQTQQKLYVVLERGGDDLSTILKKLSLQSSHLPVYTLLFYWMNMLHAVQQIHTHGVIHSDLKPANFINTDDGLKLIDFGISSVVHNDETSVIKTKSEGSCNYISPEALNCDNSDASSQGKYKVHYKSDVWSLGCILYQLVYRRTPFHHLHLWAKLANILNPNHKIEFPDACWVPPKLINTIKKCLRYDVRTRPSLQELIDEYEEMMHNI